MSGTESRPVRIRIGVRTFFWARGFCKFVSAELRHHDVENDDIEFVGLRESQPFRAINRASRSVSFLRQSLPKEVRHASFVFHDEQFHSVSKFGSLRAAFPSVERAGSTTPI